MNDNNQGFLSQLTDWPFLQEPLWRWALFFVAISAIAYAMNGMLGYVGQAAKEIAAE